MIKEYKISKHNSTVCGYPGRDFDWSNFCWDGSEVHVMQCFEPNCAHKHSTKAPLPYVDNGFIAENCEYLHIPYNWGENGTIFRVRPNESMYAGETYRGHLVKSVKAIKKTDDWYWVLELEV